MLNFQFPESYKTSLEALIITQPLKKLDAPKDFYQLTYELGGYANPTTNNRMEMSAVLAAFEFLSELGKRHDRNFIFTSTPDIHIFTDSAYTCLGISKWIHNWKKNSWKLKNRKMVLNRDLWELLDAHNNRFKPQWHKVKGHAGNINNNRVDSLAVQYSRNEKPLLTRSFPYPDNNKIPAKIISTDAIEPDRIKDKRKGINTEDLFLHDELPNTRPGFPYYISIVKGVLHRDKSWTDCESRVKGVSNARFKKVKSEPEEQAILEQWRIKDN